MMSLELYMPEWALCSENAKRLRGILKLGGRADALPLKSSISCRHLVRWQTPWLLCTSDSSNPPTASCTDRRLRVSTRAFVVAHKMLRTEYASRLFSPLGWA